MLTIFRLDPATTALGQDRVPLQRPGQTSSMGVRHSCLRFYSAPCTLGALPICNTRIRRLLSCTTHARCFAGSRYHP
jgi:hypothetical protein